MLNKPSAYRKKELSLLLVISVCVFINLIITTHYLFVDRVPYTKILEDYNQYISNIVVAYTVALLLNVGITFGASWLLKRNNLVGVYLGNIIGILFIVVVGFGYLLLISELAPRRVLGFVEIYDAGFTLLCIVDIIMLLMSGIIYYICCRRHKLKERTVK